MIRRTQQYLALLLLVLGLCFVTSILAQDRPTEPAPIIPNQAKVPPTPHDAALAASTKTVLMNDAKTGGYNIQVTSSAGVVTLTGSVDGPATAKYAEEIVRKVTGVKDVENKLAWPVSRQEWLREQGL